MKSVLLILLFPLSCLAQDISPKQAKKLGKEIIKVIRENSVFKDSLDFENIENDFLQHIDTFTTYAKVSHYYMLALHRAGDNHSFYTTGKALAAYSAKQNQDLGFSYRLLDGGIAYLAVPSFLSTDKKVTDSFANSIHNAIRQLDMNNEIKGWVIDLRSNNGGNMWPMVAGLNPLIGEDIIPGYFKTASGDIAAWKLSSMAKDISIANPYHVKNNTAKIAVLYSNKTASSGEMMAICFTGKSNSRSFGKPTGGFTTGNRIFYLSDDNIFVLATSYCLNRDKTVFKTRIQPDVAADDTPGPDALASAVEWIRQ
ncbi:MAG: S41 family peptidase [Ferruginibacter sp.]